MNIDEGDHLGLEVRSGKGAIPTQVETPQSAPAMAESYYRAASSEKEAATDGVDLTPDPAQWKIPTSSEGRKFDPGFGNI